MSAAVHLPVVSGAIPSRSNPALRATVITLVVVSIALWTASYYLPWWKLTLFAPQYPRGLRLSIFLTHLGEDAREIDMLNHYIGMAPLEHAAALERRMAGWALGLLSLLALALAFFANRRTNWLLAGVGLLLPAGFLGDSLFWMHRFGHHLDPHAPLRMKPFTPQLFGAGAIGQFRTFALPGVGFWLAVAATAVLLVAALLRRRVCEECADRETCGGVCARHFVGTT